MICSVEGCERRRWAHGLCRNHGARLKAHGDPLGGRRSPLGGTCSVEGCDRPHVGRELCALHLQRLQRTGSVETTRFKPRICVVEGCDRPHLSRGWCSMHYGRWERNGDALIVRPNPASLPGDQNCKWRGDDVGYGTAHERVRKAFGSATEKPCADCAEPAAEWSYDHRDPDELIEPDDPKRKPYSAKIEHYQPRCLPCHWRMDHPTGKPTRA
jgi:hypothetical protein